MPKRVTKTVVAANVHPTIKLIARAKDLGGVTLRELDTISGYCMTEWPEYFSGKRKPNAHFKRDLPDILKRVNQCRVNNLRGPNLRGPNPRSTRAQPALNPRSSSRQAVAHTKLPVMR